jgi:polysaccharide export outer membrane protein
MRLKATLSALFVMIVIPLSSQVVPSAGRVVPFSGEGGLPIVIGGGISDFSLDWGSGRRMEGVSAWADWNFDHAPGLLGGLGLEFEGHDMNINRPTSLSRMRQDSGEGGLIYTWRHYGNFDAYGKYLVGYGSNDFPSALHPLDTHTNAVVLAPGIGLEYRLWGHLWVRGDYEYQFWHKPYGTNDLNPNGFTIGASYNFRRHEKPVDESSGSVSDQMPVPHPIDRRLPASNGAASPSQPVAAADVKPQGEGFVIGVDDMLEINVWQQPDITRSVRVRSDGRITMALIGEVQAAGRTPLQLETEIDHELRNYIANPAVTVMVQKINSQKFNVLGQVAKPGTYSLTLETTVVDAIADAGGFKNFAKEKSVYILRENPGGGQSRIAFNYKEYIKGENPARNIKLEQNDTVIVP